jgi:glycosyltransferase involved in cell wall biosynthesis
MRISVITPVYNGEKYIEETVLSVLDAIGDSNIEYLVVDDGSNDQTLEILSKFSNRIKIISKPNGGESSAVNKGIENASGEFLLVVSADDPLFTSAIFDGITEYFDQHKEVQVWYPDWQMIDASGEVLKRVTVPEYSEERLIGRFLCLPGPGAFFRKSSALRIGGRREKWKYVGDYDFWLRISRLGTMERRPKVLAQWRYHNESTSIGQRGLRMFEERINVIEEFIAGNELDSRLIRMARSHALYFASLLVFYVPEINAKKSLFRAFALRRGLIEEAQLKVVIYILLTPLSAKLRPFISRYLKLFLRGRK